MRILIGIDDTDNAESRGTGYNARMMGCQIVELTGSKVIGITRHQLLVHDDIPYTSQNSSACIAVESKDINSIVDICSDYLAKNAAEGSDAALSVALEADINDEIIQWGMSAKKEVLKVDDVIKIANNNNIILKSITGEPVGMIGALAAIGLRKSGNDGRFIAAHNCFHLRELESGWYEPNELMSKTGSECILDDELSELIQNQKIFAGNWVRPILRNHKSTILATRKNSFYGWKTASKDIIRVLSD